MAVLDTGYTPKLHPWLDARVDAAPATLEETDVHPRNGWLDDEAGHGTFIAGLILDRAPTATIRIAKVLDSEGYGSELALAGAILEQAAAGADIVNLSLGCYTHDDQPPVALAEALRHLPATTVVVAAAGNDATHRPLWPAAHKRAIAVAAVDDRLRRARFSNYGWWVDAAAPAVDVLSTFLDFTEDGRAAAGPRARAAVVPRLGPLERHLLRRAARRRRDRGRDGAGRAPRTPAQRPPPCSRARRGRPIPTSASYSPSDAHRPARAGPDTARRRAARPRRTCISESAGRSSSIERRAQPAKPIYRKESCRPMAIMLDENRTRPHRGAGTQPRHRTAVVLDTRPFVLEIVKGVLDRSEIVTLARHTSAEAAIETIRTRRPDLFIVELGGGERDAFALASIREARDLAPGIKAIVLVDTSDEQAVQAAFGAGAVAAVSRVCRVDDLAFAVRHAFEPSIYLAQGLGAAHARSYGVGGDELSRREREILQLVAEGHSNERVARQLWVAEQTVKFHLTNIYRKLGVANRTEASRWAHENGLLTDTPAPAALARIAHGSIEPSCRRATGSAPGPS